MPVRADCVLERQSSTRFITTMSFVVITLAVFVLFTTWDASDINDRSQ
ncbi:MAG: hypothetical protein QM760_14140 [Nibricoccus sp.]